MTVQSIGSNYQNQNTFMTDFKTFSTDVNNLQSALNSGNQDQVTLSEEALSTSLGKVLNEMSGTTQGQPAGSSGMVQGNGSSNMQNLKNDLQALQSALTSAASTQGASSQSSTSAQNPVKNALNQVESDLSSKKGHGRRHHGHHGGGGSSSGSSDTSSSDSADTGSTNSLSALFGMTSSGVSQSNTNGINTLA